eukprot:CAMPEP_0201659938 /NCGR_PEP_ID=MMETSP0494-20130426/2686_1 /ASSEMBLY_ACC=CAM_ASM_000839 /TAXON_ID=420259 /ORGANISM="Thalassiosira gravida, Strain GMp14c1" /LENGTH=212 /DNA_ID=CAMNT_0048137639 /DNA_START=135 /DNA_END=773 /DNA_ORIENTATION=-
MTRQPTTTKMLSSENGGMQDSGISMFPPLEGSIFESSITSSLENTRLKPRKQSENEKGGMLTNIGLPEFPPLDNGAVLGDSSIPSSFGKTWLMPRKQPNSRTQNLSSTPCAEERERIADGVNNELPRPPTQPNLPSHENRNIVSTPINSHVRSTSDDTINLPLFPALPSENTLRLRGRNGAPPSVALRPRISLASRPTCHSPSGVDSIEMPF